ncbi:MAG: prepilin peptidase, partial [Chloroflexota bacterium]
LNVVVYPAIVIAFLAALIIQPDWLGSVGTHPVVNAAIGAAVGFVFLFIVALASRGGMGWGDVKFAAFMGAATGFPLIFVALFAGIVVGGIVGAVLLITGKKGRKQTIPFGPFLAAGTMVALLWGEQLLRWYVGLM